MAFARSLAQRFSQALPSHVDPDALESDAMLGLLMAARSFDPTRGVAFATYATPRINGAMLDGLRERQGPKVLSLDVVAYRRDGREVTRGDLVVGNGEPVGAAIERHDDIEHLLSFLSSDSRQMVREYYFGELTITQVGHLHGMFRERASKRLELARNRMRAIASRN